MARFNDFVCIGKIVIGDNIVISGGDVSVIRMHKPFARHETSGEDSKVKRAGWFVSTSDPDAVLETCSIVDYARGRAALLSKKRGEAIFVWEWNPSNGLRRVKSSARDGRVYWHRPCSFCAERGCEVCEDYGSVPDHTAPVERSGDGFG